MLNGSIKVLAMTSCYNKNHIIQLGLLLSLLLVVAVTALQIKNETASSNSWSASWMDDLFSLAPNGAFARVYPRRLVLSACT
jgi:hypothetical protein